VPLQNGSRPSKVEDLDNIPMRIAMIGPDLKTPIEVVVAVPVMMMVAHPLLQQAAKEGLAQRWQPLVAQAIGHVLQQWENAYRMLKEAERNG
jgi:hypothetical protein